MIPAAYITDWGNTIRWPTVEQIEQDLVLSRLIIEIATAVAKAAMDSGVATRPITDFYAYQQKLSSFVYRSGFVMKPVFELRRCRNSAQYSRSASILMRSA